MMIGNEPLPDSAVGTPRPPLSDEMRRTLKSVGDYIERARQHHARTGEWPPDPLLDEVDEMRRRVAAEDGYGLRKFRELMGLQESETAPHDPDPAAAE
jgi:hypothetical protein